MSNILNSSYPVTSALKPYSSFLPKESNKLNNDDNKLSVNNSLNDIENKGLDDNQDEAENVSSDESEENDENNSEEELIENINIPESETIASARKKKLDQGIENKHLTFKLPKDIEDANISKSMDMGLHKTASRPIRTRPQSASIATKTIDAPLPIRKPKSFLKKN